MFLYITFVWTGDVIVFLGCQLMSWCCHQTLFSQKPLPMNLVGQRLNFGSVV